MKKVGIVFGGRSTEADISVISAKTVIDNIDKNKYEVSNIFIDKDNNWYESTGIDSKYEVLNKNKIDNIIEYIKQFDSIFPVMHGKYGEDGTIQGMFEMFNIPYVGPGVFASSACMDKVYTKIILDRANINQVKSLYIKKEKDNFVYVDKEFNEQVLDIDEIVDIATSKINYPIFIKPSRSGSSIGINVSNNKEELKNGILDSVKYDNEILLEEGCKAREIECAVLGNEEVIASCLGEIVPDEKFYSFDSKYKNNESKLLIPAPLEESLTNEIRNTAIKAYKAVNAFGLSRVDFFVDENNNYYLNEINTIPGFTSISMYPMLFKESGIEIKDLIDKLIELSLNKK